MTSCLTFVPELTTNWPPQTKTITSPHQPSEVDDSSPPPYLPRWDSKTIEDIGLDVGDISIERKTRSQKKHANVSLMTHVLKTCDLNNYENAQDNLNGSWQSQLEWIPYSRIILGNWFLDPKGRMF